MLNWIPVITWTTNVLLVFVIFSWLKAIGVWSVRFLMSVLILRFAPPSKIENYELLKFIFEGLSKEAVRRVLYGVIVCSLAISAVFGLGSVGVISAMAIIIGLFTPRYPSCENRDSGFPKVWAMFRFLLPHHVRERIWEPCYWELMEDLYVADSECSTDFERAWVRICLSVRTVLWFANCLRAVATNSVVQWVVGRYSGK